MIKDMKSVIYIILIFTVYSCSSTRSNTHIEKQLALEDILLTSIQESSYLKELDTIYIYDHFSFDTVRANRYYHSINADIQLAFVDTFHTKIDSVSYPILWDKLRSYKNLKDTRSRIVENYFGINQINFNQSLDSYWKNDYLDMVKLFDDNWDKECVKLTGDKCQRVKLMDMVKK